MKRRGSEGAKVLQDYLDLMEEQREQMFSQLENAAPDFLWHRPGEGEWSIGENIDHLRVIYGSALSFFKLAWFFLSPLARLNRNKPYPVEIDNVYLRPGFPQNVGWIWPPKYTPGRPVSLEVLKQGVVDIHQETRDFYTEKSPDLLGHVNLYDPAIGWINLIQGLRVGIYHDELHYKHICDNLLRK